MGGGSLRDYFLNFQLGGIFGGFDEPRGHLNGNIHVEIRILGTDFFGEKRETNSMEIWMEFCSMEIQFLLKNNWFLPKFLIFNSMEISMEFRAGSMDFFRS